MRSPNYWKPGLPHLDEIEYVGIPEEQARVNALLSSDVQRPLHRQRRAAGHRNG